MSTTEYLLNAVMLAFILITNHGCMTLTRRRNMLPLVLAGVLSVVFLLHLPTIGHDITLEVTGGIAGVTLGVLAAFAVRLELRPDGSVGATAGGAFASLWVLAIGGRMVFAYGADHWFPHAIATFSQAHLITGAQAWTAAFILMAVTMLATRALLTQALGTRLVHNAKSACPACVPATNLPGNYPSSRS
jgi:hypothetical protein